MRETSIILLLKWVCVAVSSDSLIEILWPVSFLLVAYEVGRKLFIVISMGRNSEQESEKFPLICQNYVCAPFLKYVNGIREDLKQKCSYHELKYL